MKNKNIIKKLIAEGRTGEAINMLNATVFNDKEIEHQVIAVSARFKNFEKEKHGNLADISILNTELNKINQTLLHIIASISETNILKRKQI
jgi:wobble nucleotide-excising tRNase